MAPHAETDDESLGLTQHVPAPTANKDLFVVNSPDVTYTEDEIKSRYTYRTTSVERVEHGKYVATPKETVYDFKVERKVGKVGMMLVGWGGNNGSTVTAGIIANRRGLVWATREGKQAANYYGSVVMGSTMKLGTEAATGKEINVPFHDILPMVHPNDLVIGGWDISAMNLADAMDRAAVLEPALKEQVKKEMAQLKPLPSIYYPDFIAANQEGRADNLLEGSKASMAHVEQIRKDIRYAEDYSPTDMSCVMLTLYVIVISKRRTIWIRLLCSGRQTQSATRTSSLASTTPLRIFSNL